MSQVLASNGVTFSGGLSVPHGALVAFPVDPIHRDADLYPTPNEYDAFRFSRSSEHRTAQAPREQGGNEKGANAKGHLMTTITDSFFGFGQGRNSCPGRFFAAALLKMALGHILMNYEILEIQGPSEGTQIFNVTMPPASTTMLIQKKRKGEKA